MRQGTNKTDAGAAVAADPLLIRDVVLVRHRGSRPFREPAPSGGNGRQPAAAA